MGWGGERVEQKCDVRLLPYVRIELNWHGCEEFLTNVVIRTNWLLIFSIFDGLEYRGVD